MNNFDLDINLFNNLKYSLLMHGEVNVDNVFDSHMYADTNRVITLGVGFNVEKLDNIQYICALKLGVLKPVSEIEKDDGDFSFKKCLNNANKFAAVNNIASAVSACIQSVKNKGNYGIQKEDRQILNIDTQLISIEELENSIADTLSSKSSNNKQSAAQKEKTTTNTAAYGPLSHRRALLLELSVNKAIEDTINTLNETQYKNDKLNIFNFTLTKEEAVEIFSVLSMSFYKDLIRSLKTGHSKNIFSSSFALHSKLILSFLSNYYQMPDKFNTYNDPQVYFSNAISKNNSRFLTWFGIRYYIDLVSATVNNQYTLYRKRRIHEAALFELIERDADGNIDIFNSTLDIFNYLNIEMLVVHTGNRPLKDYGTGYSYLKFIEQHPHCKSVDITAQDSGVIKLSTSEEYICFLDTTTKINDILRLLQDSSSVKADDYIQEVLDFANCHKIFQPFLVYINEKFSKGIVDVDYKLDEIFVINSSNNSKFRNSLVSKISEKSNAERIEILIISLMEYNQHQRFYDILSSYDNLCITFYVLQGKNHTLTVENMTETNFKIILYTKTSEINAVNISGEYIYEREETSYFYKHKDNDKLEAEYILSENKLIIRYDKTTTVTLLNYIPSNNHCGIILSNKDIVNPEPKTVSQSGEMSIKVNFSASSIFDFNCIDKKKYYLYNVETGEIIDTLVELEGNGASASFKLNMDSGMLSNTKCIFSFFYEDICSLRLANFLSHDMCLINHFDREAKQVEVTAKINEKEVPLGVVTGIELISPSSDKLPEQSAFMSTEYKLKAITKDVEDSSQVKWCYAVLTDSEYRGKIKVSQVSESLSQTGEEISIKPEDILSESSKKKLENKDVSAKLYIFAYMKSPAYNTKHGKTHVLLLDKVLFNSMKPVIVLDAGHGIVEEAGTKKYKGAIYPKKLNYGDPNLLIIEDIVAFNFVQILQSKLCTTNYNIELTRTTDKYVYNKNRAKYASGISKKYPNANIIFLSIHLNSSEDTELSDNSSGIEFLYSDSNENLKKENIKIIECIKSTLDNSGHKYYFRKSFKKVTDKVTVLKENTVPAVLIELGFVNNKRDRENLLDNCYLNLLADNIINGINKYFEVQQ